MKKTQLSYLLYNIDEVKYSFILSLLFHHKHTLQECLFWAFELYKSQYEECLWNIITQVYYDFYCIKSISFEKKIENEYQSWKHTSSFQHIAKIVKELHKQPVSLLIFQNYYYERDDIIEHDDKTEDFYTPANIKNIICYLKLKNEDEIKAIYKKRYRVNKKERCLFYKNQKHKWIIKLACKIIKKRTFWIKTKLSDTDDIYICSLHEPCLHAYKTLRKKRLYGINDNIGAFPLNRFNEETDVVLTWDSSFNKYISDDVDKIVSAYLYNWEYYAKNTPFWSNVFKTYNVTFKKKDIVFPNDNLLEQFYDKYGFEPDEQSLCTQQKSLKPVDKTTISECFEYYGIKLQHMDHLLTYTI
jgi:hypothetical protein